MLRKNIDDLDENGKKGDWCFSSSKGELYIFIRYGDSWEQVTSAKVKGEGSWEWNESMELPTLHPSIRVFNNDGVLWHGFMIAGVLNEV